MAQWPSGLLPSSSLNFPVTTLLSYRITDLFLDGWMDGWMNGFTPTHTHKSFWEAVSCQVTFSLTVAAVLRSGCQWQEQSCWLQNISRAGQKKIRLYTSRERSKAAQCGCTMCHKLQKKMTMEQRLSALCCTNACQIAGNMVSLEYSELTLDREGT